MSQFVVQSVIPQPVFQSQYGPLYPFLMAGILDGQVESSVTINVKDPNKAPLTGQTIECLIEKRDGYGVKIKKSPPVATPPQIAAAEPLPTPPQQNYQREDPTVRQASIERQNSLTNAIAFCTAKATALISLKRADEAVKELEGKHVLQVATYFKQYNAGEINVVMTPEEVASTFGYKRDIVDIVSDMPYEAINSDEE